MALSPFRSGSPSPLVQLERPLSTGSNIKQVGQLITPSVPITTRVRPNSGMPSARRQSPGPQRTGKIDSGGRVRVAVRLRPRNAEELIADADFGDCVELQPELKRLKLRKNNWDCETFQFDEVLIDTASQKRTYEVVAKPVVESVLEGYNGTIMAYGQTGTGKTFTLGRLGKEDAADRGIMVRAMEDLFLDISSEHDSVSVSYLQLYMETVQDLLTPEKDNISIAEDPKTGDVSLPGATLVEVRDQKKFLDLLQTGEANRFAANTRLNTESSRSHAILLVNVKKTVKGKHDRDENGSNVQLSKGQYIPMVRKSKLLIVDLAGSERIDKSGNDGRTLEEAKYINLSLTALGKCINALAENSPHIPVRDSKLTRLLRDSFGGSARTSLVVTIGPSPRHRAETASTVMFGQRAMKVENMVKLKEEFDYKSLCRRLETEVDRLIAQNERQNKAVHDAEEQMEKNLKQAQISVMEAEKKLAISLEEMISDKKKLEKEHLETICKLEEEVAQRKRLEEDFTVITNKLQAQNEVDRQRHQREIQDLMQKHHLEISQAIQRLDAERLQTEALETKLLEAARSMAKDRVKTEVEDEKVLELKQKLEEEHQLRERSEIEIKRLNFQLTNYANLENTKQMEEMTILSQKLEEELKEKERLQLEIKNLKQQMLHLSLETDQTRRSLSREQPAVRPFTGAESPMNKNKTGHTKDAINGHRATIGKLFEQVGLQKILSLLESDDIDVRIHAVKVVANLAAEEANQDKIVEAGGLSSLLMLLENFEDETIRRVAAGAIANLAMNEINQELIMSQGGIRLLARTANEAEDPQTLRMVAGALANLCGNDKLQVKLEEEDGIRALLGMVRSRNSDVLAQIARGVANFAKCESRGFAQGHKRNRSSLIDDGALPWIVANANNESPPIRRHLELALCHLAQHEVNAKDLVSAGALWELTRICTECSREDIKSLAKRTLSASATFQAELRRMHLAHD